MKDYELIDWLSIRTKETKRAVRLSNLALSLYISYILFGVVYFFIQGV